MDSEKELAEQAINSSIIKLQNDIVNLNLDAGEALVYTQVILNLITIRDIIK